jgi:hypothetical protein
MGDISLFIAQAHRADESLIFDGSSSEAWADKGWLGNHALP